jgi:GWxTD domain-containing protein
MTLLTNWIQTPAARALGWTLFHFLWEGIVIAAALAAALLFLRSARARYAAACLALAAMLLACAGTFVRVLPDQTPAHPRTSAQLLRPLPPDGGDDASRTASRVRVEDVLPWTAPVWLAGVLLLHLRTILRWSAARRLCRSGVCLPPREWQQRLAALAAGVRLPAAVTLLESCRVDVPVVVGYFRPVILIPLGLLTGMTPDHMEAILLHELAHIRRRDYLVNVLQAVAENLLFYHPAVWWISGVIRTERENCCDDLVVAVRGDAYDYAVALASLEENRHAGEPALAASGGNLMKRIHRLLDRPEPRHAALTPVFSASLVLVTAAVALVAWQPAPDQPPQQSPELATMPPYQKWMVQDVAYIISDEERAAFRQLTTDEEREHFIEQFWLRRDPTPGTPENEMKEEHYRRIAYANQHFAPASGLAGWKTDRGRIYIIYGPPDELESHPNDPSTPYRYQLWRYRHLAGMGDNIIVQFNDRARNGEYRMLAEASVQRAAIWTGVVKRGDMQRQVRALSTLGAGGTAEVKIAEPQLKELHLGQTAAVDFRGTLGSGRVAHIDPLVVNGTVNVTIQLDAPPPATAQPGQPVDAIIDIELIRDVVYVPRPAFAQPNSTAVLFKIEADTQHAVQVPVRFGRTSVNQIEVLGGIAPGDRIILSDMSPYTQFDRVAVR